MVALNFDANKVEPASPPEAIPAGKYLAAIVSSENKPTKSRNGGFLELKFQILQGDYRGRHVWVRLNLDNPNPEAVKYARIELSTICHAVGVLKPNDSVELHNLPLIIHVKCRNRPDTGEIVNEVKGYEAKEAAAGQHQQAPVTDNTPPWKRQPA